MTEPASPARYVLASSKPWHDGLEATLAAEIGGAWTRVRTPEELVAATAEPAAVRTVFFLHWNWIVPTPVWSRVECVCFHMTDVPYGRGGSPLQNLIVRGHRETRVTALRMVADLDAGPVYGKRPLALDGRAVEIYARATEASLDLLRWIVRERPEPTPQTGEPTVFARRRPEQSALPAAGSLEALHDHIRMLDAPTYPLAFLEHGDFRLEFEQASLDGDALRATVTIRRTAPIPNP